MARLLNYSAWPPFMVKAAHNAGDKTHDPYAFSTGIPLAGGF